MNDFASRHARAQRISGAASIIYARRVKNAADKYQQRVSQAQSAFQAESKPPGTPLDLWRDWTAWATDAAQRSVLLLDTLRRRGNQWLEHERAGKPPVLHFQHEVVLDARSFDRPVNYALLRILPPEGVEIDPGKRPYMIIDPRAGHGPGIGGFKDDSQVGVALAAGHPVYFVMFYPEPMPGQTLLDVTAAERLFVAKVRELHPDSPKPAVVGNCQGGWSAMMLAASDPDDTGPLVINGAPMSYWGGAWSGGEGDNPMRYSGGMLGGTWLSSLASDLGNGVFDGAYLVQNFEQLNPANTYFDKYYHLYANVDTEPPRFLEFERWWGGFYLLNREEIEWITQNLFVGNKLWKGEVKSAAGKVFDLREVKSPIVLFASMGDNITPPQQAFNWVADVYGSTEEIKARGQTIVGLLHENVGHLGIFVSGSVAKREHRQIVSVLESIEALPPGLYGMRIHERPGRDGRPEYEVDFVEHELEEIMSRLNRFERVDEKAFEYVARISEFNQRAYELFAQSAVRSMSNESAAQTARLVHPLRMERWSISDINPWLWWVDAAAQAIRANRQPADDDQVFSQAQKLGAALIGAGWDLYRDLRDATSEATFLQVYGGLFALNVSEAGAAPGERPKVDRRDSETVREALARIEQGGYPAAVARTAYLLARRGQTIPLERIQAKTELIREFRDLMPDLTADQMRRVRGEQEIIVDYEPRRAIETLPALLADPDDRARYFQLFERLLADPRVRRQEPTPEQRDMLAQLRLAIPAGTKRAPAGRAGGTARSSGTKRSSGASRKRSGARRRGASK